MSFWTRHTREQDFIRKVTRQISRSLNYITLAIFAPVLVVVGMAGFLVPVEKSLTSGAPPYNVFHICFGVLGLLLVWSKKEPAIITFNLGFGLIDLYQALASFIHLPPEQYFHWTRVDDILHLAIGSALVGIGLYGLRKLPQIRAEKRR